MLSSLSIWNHSTVTIGCINQEGTRRALRITRVHFYNMLENIWGKIPCMHFYCTLKQYLIGRTDDIWIPLTLPTISWDQHWMDSTIKRTKSTFSLYQPGGTGDQYRFNESNNRWNINWERIFKAYLEHNPNCIRVDQSSIYRWNGSHPFWGGLIGDWVQQIRPSRNRKWCA